MVGRGHRQIEHTADLALELWAPTEAELLLEGAVALVGLLTEGAPVSGTTRRELHLAAMDPEDRLVQWLNRVLVLAIVEGYLVSDGELRLEGSNLQASLRGEDGAHEKIRTELKSATYHDLYVGCEDGRWLARIVIDV